MNVRLSVGRFEDKLMGMVGNITLYRLGINEFYLSHGFPGMYEELEAIRPKLEAIGMFEQCSTALAQAEALVRQGPEHDREAELVLLTACGQLARASGSFDAIERKFAGANDESFTRSSPV